MSPILVVLENNLRAAQPALQKAARVAMQKDAPLIITVNTWSATIVRVAGKNPAVLKSAQTAIQNAWHQRINDLISESGLSDHACEICVYCEKHDEDALRDIILSQRPALVAIKAVADKTGQLQRLFLAPRDWILLRNAPCSVLCVDDTPWPEYLPVLAAVDPDHDDEDSALNQVILDNAVSLSVTLGGDLRLTHVLERPDETLILLAGEAIPSYLTDIESQRDYYQKRLEKLCEERGLAKDRALLLDGLAASALAEYQHQHAPVLLVLGTVGRGKLGRMFLGSTAEQILGQAGGELLAVKTADFQSPWEH